MASVCEQEKENLGAKCNDLPSLPACMIETPDNFFIAPDDYATEALLLAKLQDAILDVSSKRIYYWPFFDGYEGNNEDTVYEENALADLKVRNGKYRFRVFFAKGLCLHKAMFTHATKGGRVFLYDVDGRLFGTRDSQGNLRGFSISLLNPEKLIISDGSVATKSPVYVVLANSNEADKNGYVIDLPELTTLNRLTDVTLAVVGTPTATTIVVSVTASCDGTPISGLVTADFVVTTAAGATQVVTAAEGDEGVYTLTGTDMVSGFVNLVAPASLSIEAYESTGKQTVTIA